VRARALRVTSEGAKNAFRVKTCRAADGKSLALDGRQRNEWDVACEGGAARLDEAANSQRHSNLVTPLETGDGERCLRAAVYFAVSSNDQFYIRSSLSLH